MCWKSALDERKKRINWTGVPGKSPVRSWLQWRTIHQGAQLRASVIPPWRLDTARIRGHIPIREKKEVFMGIIRRLDSPSSEEIQ